MVCELEAMCDSAEIKIEYLLLYSPDFNSIEETFAELKAWIHRNNVLAEGVDSFDQFLNMGLESMVRRPENHFRSAGYAR